MSLLYLFSLLLDDCGREEHTKKCVASFPNQIKQFLVNRRSVRTLIQGMDDCRSAAI